MSVDIGPHGPLNPPGDPRGVLRVSTCGDCSRTEFPAQDACPACGGASPRARLTVPGLLTRLTTVLFPPPGGLVPVPYAVGVVEFAEGISIMGRVIGEVAIGDAVTPAHAELPNGEETYVFEIASDRVD